MALTRTTVLLLLCSLTFVTTPAAGKPLHRSEDVLVLRDVNRAAEFTDMSARRRHVATSGHVKRHRVKHHRVKHHRVKYHLVKHHRAKRYGFHRRGVAGRAYRGARYSNFASVLARRGVSQHAHAAADRKSVRSDVATATVRGFGLVAEARRYIGTNPTGHSRLWCARFLNMVLERSGLSGSGSNMARSFASYGRRVSGPQVGAIAVMSRGRRGGHVGVVSGIDANGNPIVISGNHGRRVAESAYSRGRVYAYVMP